MSEFFGFGQKGLFWELKNWIEMSNTCKNNRTENVIIPSIHILNVDFH